MKQPSLLNSQSTSKQSRSRARNNQNLSFNLSPMRAVKAKGLRIDCSFLSANQRSNKLKDRSTKSPMSPNSPVSTKLGSPLCSPKLKTSNSQKKKTSSKNLNQKVIQKELLKLIRPYIAQERKIGLLNIRKTINHNFNFYFKWTIIRDIEGYLLDSTNEFSLHMIFKHYIDYMSTVIDMDRFTPKDSVECKQTIKKAMETGTWITFGFNHKICSITHLIKHKILPENFMSFPSSDDFKYSNFRIIFVSRKLEYPKDLLESSVLVSIDEEIIEKEKDLLKLNRVKWSNKPVKQIQKELDFVDACFNGMYDECKQMMNDSGMNANVKDLNSNTALMEAALQGHHKVCQLLLSHGKDEIDINAVNKDNKTALHKAAFNGNAKIIELLLNKYLELKRICSYLFEVGACTSFNGWWMLSDHD